MYAVDFIVFKKIVGIISGFKSEVICAVRNLDINQVPSGGVEEEWITMNMEDEEESSNGGPPRKKLRLTKEQSRLLEESFRQNHTLNPVILSWLLPVCTIWSISPAPIYSLTNRNQMKGCNAFLFFPLLNILIMFINLFGFFFLFFFSAEAKREFGYAVEAEAEASWGVVPEP